MPIVVLGRAEDEVEDEQAAGVVEEDEDLNLNRNQPMTMAQPTRTRKKPMRLLPLPNLPNRPKRLETRRTITIITLLPPHHIQSIQKPPLILHIQPTRNDPRSKRRTR